MRRLLLIATSVALLMAIMAPTALAAGPSIDRGSLLLAANGAVVLPAGETVDAVVVLDGNATVNGTATTIVVVNGTATITGATARDLVVIDGTVDLGPGTTITGNVRTLHATINRDASAVIAGSITALDTTLAASAILLVPVLIVVAVGLAIAAIVAGLFVAAFAARQVRQAEDLISAQPGQTLLAGIAGTILAPIVAVLLIMTVVGAPIGFAMLLGVLPVVAFVAWLVAAIWVGDWLVTRTRGAREPGHPYRAAIFGVILLAVAGTLPLVSGIATLFGFGALLISGWRMLRPTTPVAGPVGPVGPGQAWPATS